MHTIESIREAVTPLAIKYNVQKVELFGSYANGTATEKSDADFMVLFDPPIISLFKVMGFKESLKNNLGIPVDLLTLPLENMPDIFRIDKVVDIYERS